MNTNRKLSAAAALLSAFAATNALGQVSNWATAVSGNWNDASKWDSGVPMVSSQSAVLGLTNPYTVTLNISPTIGGLQILNSNALLSVSPGTTLGLSASSVTNNGIIQVNPSGSATNAIIRVDNPMTISGTGEIRMRTEGSDDSQIAGAGILTNAAGHTIRGVGRILTQTVNDGTIAGDVGVSVSGATLTVFGDVVNNAQMEARANSNLNLSAVSINQTSGGSLLAANTGNINVVSGNTDVLFGTIESAGNGEFNVVNGGTATLSGVTNNGTIEVHPGGAVVVDAVGLENNGIIDINRFGSATNAVFQLSASADILGTGVINMKSQGSDDSQINTAPGAVLTQGVDHEIRGVGYINAELVNDGIVTADVAVSVSGNALVLQGSPKTNNDIMAAANGSILQFSGVTLDQTGGGQLVTSGGEIRLSNTNVLEGTYNTFGGFMRSQGSTNSMSGFVNNGQIIVDANSTVQIDGGGMVNNGEIQLNQVGSSADSVIDFTQTASLLGSGQIQMRTQGSNDSQINTAMGATLTHGASHLIRGVGYIGADMVNNGEVRADSSVSVSGSALVLHTNNKINNGLFVAAPSSTFVLTGIGVNQTGGGSMVANDGAFQLDSASITGGSYAATGTGILRTNSGTSSVAGMTFDGPSVVNASTTLQIGSGGLENNGIMELNISGSASNAVLVATDSVGLSGTGEIRMRSRGSDDSQLNTATGKTITHGANHKIRGVGYINASMVNNGALSADVAVSVSGSQLDLQGENKTNAGVMSAELNSALHINGVTITQTGTGRIEANSGTVALFNGASVVGGPINATGNGSYIVSGATTFDGVTLNAPGTVNAGQTLTIASSPLVNNARMVVNPGFSASDGIVNFPASTTLTGSGEINLTANGADARFTSAGTITNGSGHTVSGRGQIQAPFVNQGILAPGTNDIATMSATVGATFGAGGTYRVEINGNSADRLSVTGTANLGGTLNLALGAGATMAINNSTTILSGTSVVGTFNTVNHLQSGNLITRVVYEPTQVRVLIRCIADVNLDGSVTPADFTAWIAAYNASSNLADQNLDGNVTPADFTAWIANFNAGCP